MLFFSVFLQTEEQPHTTTIRSNLTVSFNQVFYYT
jgi:hypothetical protein